MQFTPPPTPEKPVTDTLHGVQLTDPYRWLEDKNDEEVVRWTQAQHEATMRYLEAGKSIPGLREEITAYIDRDIQGPIFLEGQRQFFYLKKKGEPQYKLYTRIEDEDRIVFDPVRLDPTGLSAISGVAFTKEGDRVAVGIQHKGAEISSYYIVDTTSGEIEGVPIEGLRGFTWTKDERHAYITVGTQEMLEQQIPLKTFLHRIGSSRAEDKFLFAPDDAKNFMSIWDAKYSELTFISSGDFYSNSLKMRPVGQLEGERLIYESKKYRAQPFALNDRLYFLTNHEAPNFKIMSASREHPAFKDWQTLLPEREDMVLQSFVITPDYLLVQAKKNVVSSLFAYSLDGTFLREIDSPELGSVGGLSYHRPSNVLYVNMNSFTSPGRVYSLNGQTLEWQLYFEREAPLDTENIEAHIQFYSSKDGTKIPLFIMHQKGLKLDGTHPGYLYGYGGFNVGMSPAYVGLAATFINRGGVYAIACIRGGDEYGEKWHEDGMLFKKQNSFDDFIAAAEFLAEKGYTSHERLALRGGSNGGLLIGAVLTQRPDICRTAICAVPLLDMLRFHKFLIARYWIPEYGNPDKREDFINILTYSPYHHIRRGINLPTTLVVAGENDTRVDPLHAKKFVAALQNNPGQLSPILLYMDYDSGHGSGKSTEQMIDDLENQYGFLLRELGM